MAKMKVYELAKELDIQSKDVISFLQEKGVEVKAAQSSVEEEQVNLVQNRFGKEKKSDIKETNADSKTKAAAKPAEAEIKEKAAVYKVDIDESQALAQEYRVMSVPTMKIFKDGEVVETIVGLQSKGVLIEKLNYYIG